MDPADECRKQSASALYRVKVATAQGSLTIEARRHWAPRGAGRFYNPVRAGLHDDSRFFRLIAGDFAQFGIPGDPLLAATRRHASLPDGKAEQWRGYVAYALTGLDAFVHYRARIVHIKRIGAQQSVRASAAIGARIEKVVPANLERKLKRLPTCCPERVFSERNAH